jgi:hypothetical protein
MMREAEAEVGTPVAVLVNLKVNKGNCSFKSIGGGRKKRVGGKK